MFFILWTFMFWYTWLEMGPDPSRAYFWPAVKERPTHLWPGTFRPDLKRFFLTWRRKNWKIWHFDGKFSKPRPKPRWLTRPDPTKIELTPIKIFDPVPSLYNVHDTVSITKSTDHGSKSLVINKFTIKKTCIFCMWKNAEPSMNAHVCQLSFEARGLKFCMQTPMTDALSEGVAYWPGKALISQLLNKIQKSGR